MSVLAEKGKTGAHRKGGLVLMWVQRQKRVLRHGRGARGRELSVRYSIACVQQI